MPNSQYLIRAKKVRMYYDPRGQVVKTENPDGTQQQVLFGVPNNITDPPATPLVRNKHQSTPWESYTYDANDLAPRSHPGQLAAETGVNPNHHWTPSSSLLDPLGRTIKTVDRNGSQIADEVVMQYEFDIRGNLLKVTDALGRTAFTHVYDLKPKGESEEDKGANILKTTHIDSGTKTALFDAAYRPTELRDAKGALILHGYDELNRPTRIWARDNDSEDVTLRQKLIYGDDTTDGPSIPTDTNHLGKLYQHYDEAGKVTMDGYDFKGNLLEKTRKVISDAELLSVFGGGTIDCYRVDWGTSTDSILGSEDFRTDTSFDAFNRPKQITYPEDVNTDRKVATPTYNRAGALESVDFDGTNFVEHIAYNAKGQRLLIAFGNGVMTRYTYDSETFRLIRQRSETYTLTDWTFSSNGSVKQDTGYKHDLSGNIIKTTERTTNCGVGGTNELDRHYQYDALYRLLQATGRENAPTITPIWDDRYRSTDHSITTAYTQNYSYDKMGNILKLQHIGNSNFTRIFNPTEGNPPDDYGTRNLLNEVKIGGTTYEFTYDDNGNLIQENASRFMEWDHADKMRCFYVDDGGTVTKYAHYLYDAGGNRVKKLVSNDGGSYTSTSYIDGFYEYLTDGTDEQSLSHVMDDKSRIAMVFEGDMFGDPKPPIRYVLEDHLGNSINELRDDGADIEKEEYYPFGETSFASYSFKRYKYNGKERDEESGFYNYGMRYYNAWTCRFISVDPIKSDYMKLTPYQYGSNNPYNGRDIDGLESETGQGQTNTSSNKIQQSEISDLEAQNIGSLAGLDELDFILDDNFSNQPINDPNSSGSSDTQRIIVSAAQKDDKLLVSIESAGKTIGYQLTVSESVRKDYNKVLETIVENTLENQIARDKIKVEYRNMTPAMTRSILNYTRPLNVKSGSRTSPGKASPKYNKGAYIVGVAGKGLLVLGAASSVYNIATADDPAGQTAKEAFSWGGAIAGGELGSEFGLLVGEFFGPIGAIVGAVSVGIVGSVIGGVFGSHAADVIFGRRNPYQFEFGGGRFGGAGAGGFW